MFSLMCKNLDLEKTTMNTRRGALGAAWEVMGEESERENILSIHCMYR
jgi:hypothetical protein